MGERQSFVSGIGLMIRSEHYRKQASECLARSRASSDQKDAAQLAIIAATYFQLAMQREEATEAWTDREQRVSE
jgi:hypothetical protein